MSTKNRTRFYFIYVLCITPFLAIAQKDSSINIDFKDYRIKLDGGCSFYTYDSIPIDLDKYIFIIDVRKIGFFNIGSDYVYIKRNKRIKKDHGFRDVFSGHGYDVILNVAKTGENDKNGYGAIYQGTLVIKHNSSSETFKVHGKVAEL